MEAIAITGSLREGTGKGPNRRLRAKGGLPAVVYGFGLESALSVSLDPRALTKALLNPKGRNALMDLTVEGNGQHKVLVRELQRHPVSRNILHVDLVAPDPEQVLFADVPVNFKGEAKGAQLGGRLIKPYREIKIAAIPANIPAEVAVDVTEMDLGDVVMASELNFEGGAKAIYDRDYVVVKMATPRGTALEDEEQTEAETETETKAETET